MLGFFLAAGLATALSGVGGAAGFALFHASQAPVLATWLNWFASDAIGVAIVAPLTIGVIRSLRDPPSLRELAGRGVHACGAFWRERVGFFSPTDYWFTVLPFALTLAPIDLAGCPMPTGVHSSRFIHYRTW